MYKIFFLIFTGMSIFCISSCKKNDIGVNNTTLGYVSFSTTNNADTVSVYYVKSSTSGFKIPVGITNTSSKNRNIQFSYTSSSAIQGQQFTAPTSIVIAAGKSLDSLIIQGLFSGFSKLDRLDTLKITITGGDALVNATKFNYIVYMRKYCDVVETQLAGNYGNTEDYSGGQPSSQGPYTAKLINWVSTGDSTATAYIINLGATSDYGWGPFPPNSPASNPGIKVTFDWTNPTAFKATIASQAYFDDGSGISKISSTTGTFSTCDNTITLPCSVLYAGNGNTYTTTTILKK